MGAHGVWYSDWRKVGLRVAAQNMPPTLDSPRSQGSISIFSNAPSSPSGVMELVGIVAGHVYYFLKFKYPETSGWDILATPNWMYVCCAAQHPLRLSLKTFAQGSTRAHSRTPRSPFFFSRTVRTSFQNLAQLPSAVLAPCPVRNPLLGPAVVWEATRVNETIFLTFSCNNYFTGVDSCN